MLYVKIAIETAGQLQDYLKKNAWSGAKDRVEKMSYADCERLYNFLDWYNEDEPIDETKLNDFIWFDWDYIKDNFDKE